MEIKPKEITIRDLANGYADKPPKVALSATAANWIFARRIRGSSSTRTSSATRSSTPLTTIFR